MELEGFSDKDAPRRRVAEVAPYFFQEASQNMRNKAVEASISSQSFTAISSDREMDSNQVAGLGIQEIEENILILLRLEDI